MAAKSEVFKIEGRYDVNKIIAGWKRAYAEGKKFEQLLKDIHKQGKINIQAAAQHRVPGVGGTGIGGPGVPATQRGFQQFLNQFHRFQTASREVAYLWQSHVAGVRRFTDAAASLLRAEARFRALNLGARDTAIGLAAVRKVAADVKGVRFDDVTDDLIGLKSAVGDLGTAIDILPVAAKTRFTFQTLFQADPKQLERDITLTMRALEQMGAIRQMPGGGIDVERFQKFYDAVLRIRAFTGGRIGGAELRQFVGRGGISAMQLSPEGLMHMASLMEAMGGAAVGTSLMSAFMSFVAMRQGAGGKMSAQTMAQLGLLDMKKVELTKEGRIAKALPGAMPIADLLSESPIKFADALSQAITRHGASVLGKPVDVTNVGDIGRILARITPNRRAADMLAKMIVMRENISKDVRAMEKSMGLEEMYKMATESPMGKMQQFQTAWDNFLAESGKGMIELLGNMAQVAGPAFAWLSQHPSVAKFGLALIMAAKGGHLLFGVMAAFREFRAMGAIINSTAAAVGNVGTQARSASGAVVGLRGSLMSLGSAAAVAGIGLLIMHLMKLKDEADAAWSSADEAAKKSADSTKKLIGAAKIEDIKRLTSAQMPATIARMRGDIGVRERLDLMYGSGLSDLVARNVAKVVGAGRTERENFGLIAGRLRKTTPELGIPSQFAQFMLHMSKGEATGIPAAERHALTQSAAMAFPEAAKAYGEALRASGGDIAKARDALIEADKNTMRVQEELRTAVQNTTSAFQGLGPAIEALKSQMMGGTPAQGGTEGVPVIEGEHAAGGLTKRDHVARVHRNELITPLDQAWSMFGQAGTGHNITVNLSGIGGQGAASESAIEKAAYRGVQAALAQEQVETTLRARLRERQLGI